MDKIKVFFVAVIGALTSFLGVLAIPAYLLVGCSVIDYVTGIMASKPRGEKISSYKGSRGIQKKIGQWLLVVIGAWVDVLIRYSVESVGIDWKFPFIVAIIVSIWLVVNEMLSILENLSDLGVKLPPFLKPIINRLKTEVEDVGSQIAEEEQNEDSN